MRWPFYLYHRLPANMSTNFIFGSVTRVEVIDSTGRVFVSYYTPGVTVQLQDGERTMKIFAGDPVESP